MFLMTVEQYKVQAASLRKSGNEQLAQQYDNLVKLRTAPMTEIMPPGYPPMAVLQKKLDEVRQEVRNLTVISMRPDQTPEQQALLKNLERSARAELKSRIKALEYAEEYAKSQRTNSR